MSISIREAILKAADWIEKNPKSFRFCNIYVPSDCGSPGCAIGWVSHFAGVRLGESFRVTDNYANGAWDTCLGVTDYEFYKRMDALTVSNWKSCAKSCASGLRHYADKYHPAESTKAHPEGSAIVRAFLAKPSKELVNELQNERLQA